MLEQFRRVTRKGNYNTIAFFRSGGERRGVEGSGWERRGAEGSGGEGSGWEGGSDRDGRGGGGEA